MRKGGGRIAKFKHELAKLVFVVALMALMLAFFGGLSMLVSYLGLDYVLIISAVVAACGLYMVLISIKFHAAAGRKKLNLPGIALGTALMCGAALYGVLESASWFVVCLLVPFVIGGVLAGIKSRSRTRGKAREGAGESSGGP